MPIQVSANTPQTRYLSITDPSGATYVIINPPDYAAESERGEMLKKRTLVPDGVYLRTQVEVNLNDLWALEIWLTYQETNLHVQYKDEEDKVVKEVKFEPRDQVSRGEFLKRVGELPPGMVYEWHMKVVEVVRDWNVPF